MATWAGSIEQANGPSLHDIHISSPHGSQWLTKEARLTLLSVVDIGRIPLHLRYGPILNVHTSKPDTEAWFDALLCSEADDWHLRKYESPTGLLVSVDQPRIPTAERPHVTDIVFFAARHSDPSPPTPPRSSVGTNPDSLLETIHVRAILLSDDLDAPIPTTELTPPSSPTSTAIKGVFLPSFASDRKRKALADTFDAAAKRRRQTKRNIGDSVAAAAAQHSRPSTSSSNHHAFPIPAPPQARHPSISLARQSPAPSSRGATPSLAPPKSDPNPVETANKSLLTRLILTSLRLHGLSGSRVPIASRTPTDHAAEEDFKTTYHAVLRGAQFALRRHMAVTELSSHVDRVRDVVDSLLGMFCADPLEEIGEMGTPFATPGEGKSPFVTPREQRGGTGFPFPAVTPVREGKGKEREVVPRRKREAGF
ncbi:hypothetical protein K461DRAFT_93284 [Myriangium duriaei CBS 260.36]|uniref:Sld7 C-terminal domain-containing protein n=1 Tax=Myriangium duriaei CBS 260.36 TaxID=1168546 RepID=A0A9P4MKE8_9PEZI|nr:hypothetical protein K461DRAFT_93284 [Myriangium duriaei CBS 260.36]